MEDESVLDLSQARALNGLDVLAALAKLPTGQRTILLLIATEEMTYAEAARIVGVPVGTVMSRLSRGRKRLRQLVSVEKTAPREAIFRGLK